LEDVWDHRFLLWDEDPLRSQLRDIVPEDIVTVPFNPTAENMAKYLVKEVGPMVLPGNLILISARVEETRKCSATYTLPGY
jgi:6-pyruvoyltetrahydropterin/6-carboxytetrahydropterin synthase